MWTKSITLLALAATLAIPTLGAEGDTYPIKDAGKQVGVLKVAKVHKGTIDYSTDDLSDLQNELSKALDAKYDDGDEYEGSTTIDDKKLEASVQVSGAQVKLKDAFKQVTYEVINYLGIFTIVEDNTEDEKGPDELLVNIFNTGPGGDIKGPCLNEGDCSFYLEYK